MGLKTETATEKAIALLKTVEGLRKKVVGKSIPDEKYVSQKATLFLENKSKLALAIPEAAYVFNYLKMGNNNEKIAKFWREFIKQRQNQIGKL